MYVILSVSEISHDQSDKYIPVSSSVGFFTTFRMTYFLPLPGICSLGIDRMTCNFASSFGGSGLQA